MDKYYDRQYEKSEARKPWDALLRELATPDNKEEMSILQELATECVSMRVECPVYHSDKKTFQWTGDVELVIDGQLFKLHFKSRKLATGKLAEETLSTRKPQMAAEFIWIHI